MTLILKISRQDHLHHIGSRSVPYKQLKLPTRELLDYLCRLICLIKQTLQNYKNFKVTYLVKK